MMMKSLRSVGMLLAVAVAMAVGAGTAESSEVDAAQAVSAKTSAEEQRPATPAQLSKSDLEEKLKNRLVSLGLTADEAADKIAGLTPADLQKLGENPEQVAMAGLKDTTLILIAVILVVPSLLLLLMI